MKRVIRVVQGFYPNSYNSISDAIVAAKFENDSNEFKSSLINGRIVENYQFNGELLVIGFDNGKFLTIYPEENKIGWNVVSEWPMVTGKYENEYENIYFKFPGGEEVLWNWKDILDSFVGKQVAISVSDQFLFIFTRDGVEYMFDVLLDVNNKNSRFLFLSQA